MPPTSAGLLMFRQSGPAALTEVLLIHPGGPFWAGKDAGAWMIPKGAVERGEGLLEAAKREFAEETGLTPPAEEGAYLSIGSVKQRGGKVVHAWAFAGDCDPASIRSIMMPLQWPPRSGKWIEVPEVDKAAWFSVEAARGKMLLSQTPFLGSLEAALRAAPRGA